MKGGYGMNHFIDVPGVDKGSYLCQPRDTRGVPKKIQLMVKSFSLR